MMYFNFLNTMNMKRLVLIRHAKSDWSIPGQKDFDRELNTRGVMDAPRMGARLKELQIFPTLVVCSPAQRAKQTMEFITEQLNVNEALITFEEDVYEASARTLLHIVNTLDNSQSCVFMVGHNPGMSFFSEYLTGKETGDMPTCSIAVIDFETDDWATVSQRTGNLTHYIYPKDQEN
jgi:phosphohistidine phosphatase